MRKVVKLIRITIAVIFILPVLLVISLVSMVIGGLLRVIGLKRLSDGFSHFILQAVVWWIMLCLGSVVHLRGLENLPPRGTKYVLFPNHQSAVDIPAIYYLRRWPGMIAKRELYSIPILNGLLWLLHCVPINRKSPRDAVKAIHTGIDRIEKGIPMVIFPEGTRSKTGKIGTFKAGSFKMAIRSGAMAVPVCIKNTRPLLEGAYRFGFVPVYIEVLPAIDASALNEEELKALPERVEAMVKEAYEGLPSWPNKK